MQDKLIVRDYFNSVGFERWSRIYGDATDINWVQQDIRQGHSRTVETVLQWLDGSLTGKTVCDAGCGVGSLSLPLSQQGALVYASDISEQMILRARQLQRELYGQTGNPQFRVADLEALDGRYDVVISLDVMIHYPEADALQLIDKLVQLTKSQLIFSFAPKTRFLSALKKVGEFFPGPSKTTRAYQHREDVLVDRLTHLGWQVTQKATIKSQFYYSWILNLEPMNP